MDPNKKAKFAFGALAAAGLMFLTGYVGKSKRLSGFRRRTGRRFRVAYRYGRRSFKRGYGRFRRSRYGRRFSYRRRSR